MCVSMGMCMCEDIDVHFQCPLWKEGGGGGQKMPEGQLGSYYNSLGEKQWAKELQWTWMNMCALEIECSA